MVLTTVQEHQQREAQMQKKGARAHTHPTPCDCAAVHIQATVLDPIAMANTVEREFYYLHHGANASAVSAPAGGGHDLWRPAG